MLSSDYLRQRALYSLQDLVTRHLTEDCLQYHGLSDGRKTSVSLGEREEREGGRGEGRNGKGEMGERGRRKEGGRGKRERERRRREGGGRGREGGRRGREGRRERGKAMGCKV